MTVDIFFILPLNNFISTTQKYTVVFIETIANIGYILYAYWEENPWILSVKSEHYRALQQKQGLCPILRKKEGEQRFEIEFNVAPLLLSKISV